MTAARKTSLKTLLSGRDRRSIAQSRRALEELRRDKSLVAELAALAEDDDWLVSMRAFDLLEKLAHENADLIEPYKNLFVGPLADSDKWEIRLQVVRALPLFKWTTAKRKRVIAILRGNLDHPQTFVRAWALDGLATFAEHDSSLMPDVERSLALFEQSESKALQARARKIRERLR
jgi:HEAT repeat protein